MEYRSVMKMSLKRKSLSRNLKTSRNSVMAGRS
jgi:hypothetical protein